MKRKEKKRNWRWLFIFDGNHLFIELWLKQTISRANLSWKPSYRRPDPHPEIDCIMSNNFMGGGGNSALSKNSTDGILNLLQLSLLGNNAGVNATSTPTSNISNTNNLMAAKANFYSQSVGANLSGIGVNNISGGIMTSQSMISQPVSLHTISFCW